MNRLNLIVAFICAVLVTSCSSDEPMPIQQTEPSVQSNPFGINEEKAIEIAGKYRESMFGTTRAIPKLKSVDRIMSRSTRSNDSEPMYYIINYEDNGGFAVVTAQPNDVPLRAISDKGHMEISDTLENEGLAIFFNQLDQSIVNGFGGFIQPKDTTIHPIETYPSYTFEVKPKLSENVSKWFQESPFNQFCPMVTFPNGSQVRGLVGCVPLSTAQILSYYKWPNKIQDLDINWELLNQLDNITTYVMLGSLGSPFFYNANYGYYISNGEICLNTGIPKNEIQSRVNNVFQKLGYYSPTMHSFNAETVTSDINKGPILVCSDFQRGNEYALSHAWVMDGYQVVTFYTNDFATGEKIEKQARYFNCVWGKGSSVTNGYYYWDNKIYLNGFNTVNMFYFTDFNIKQ